MSDENILLHMTYNWYRMDNYIHAKMPRDMHVSYRISEFELVPYDNYSIEHEYTVYWVICIDDKDRNVVSIPIMDLEDYI